MTTCHRSWLVWCSTNESDYHTYVLQKLLADIVEGLTPIEISLQGCHDYLWSDTTGLLTTQVVDHMNEVAQTKEVLEPEGDSKFHVLQIVSASLQVYCNMCFVVTHHLWLFIQKRYGTHNFSTVMASASS